MCSARPPPIEGGSVLDAFACLLYVVNQPVDATELAILKDYVFLVRSTRSRVAPVIGDGLASLIKVLQLWECRMLCHRCCRHRW